MSGGIITLGMDVHKDSITLAVLPDQAAAPTRVDRLPTISASCAATVTGWPSRASCGPVTRRVVRAT